MKIKKGQSAFVARTIDCRNTGGPLIPKGAGVTVLIRCRDGQTLWVDLGKHGGRRRVFRKDIAQTI